MHDLPADYANQHVRLLPPDVDSLWISADDSTRVEAWFLPGPGPHPLVIFFHGNGELSDTNLDMADLYHPWRVSSNLRHSLG